MRWVPILALLLVGFMESHAKQDLGKKVFIFPRETSTAHVILTPELKTSLQMFSVCLKSYTDLSRTHTLFSLAMSEGNITNALTIFFKPPDSSYVYINDEEIFFGTDSNILDWKHTCVSWDSKTSIIQHWVNGKLSPRKMSNKGFSIKPEISIILGQDQDSFGGGFVENESFVGELSDVHMWDYILTPADVQKVMKGEKTGNVINWRSLTFEMKGDVLILPELQCNSCGSTPILSVLN